MRIVQAPTLHERTLQHHGQQTRGLFFFRWPLPETLSGSPRPQWRSRSFAAANVLSEVSPPKADATLNVLFRCVTKKAIGETKQGFVAKWLISSLLSIRNGFRLPFCFCLEEHCSGGQGSRSESPAGMGLQRLLWLGVCPKQPQYNSVVIGYIGLVFSSQMREGGTGLARPA